MTASTNTARCRPCLGMTLRGLDVSCSASSWQLRLSAARPSPVHAWRCFAGCNVTQYPHPQQRYRAHRLYLFVGPRQVSPQGVFLWYICCRVDLCARSIEIVDWPRYRVEYLSRTRLPLMSGAQHEGAIWRDGADCSCSEPRAGDGQGSN